MAFSHLNSVIVLFCQYLGLLWLSLIAKWLVGGRNLRCWAIELLCVCGLYVDSIFPLELRSFAVSWLYLSCLHFSLFLSSSIQSLFAFPFVNLPFIVPLLSPISPSLCLFLSHLPLFHSLWESIHFISFVAILCQYSLFYSCKFECISDRQQLLGYLKSIVNCQSEHNSSIEQ